MSNFTFIQNGALALGPVVFDGWDADGQPVGKPSSEIRTGSATTCCDG
jgi:hypothetical protein